MSVGFMMSKGRSLDFTIQHWGKKADINAFKFSRGNLLVADFTGF